MDSGEYGRCPNSMDGKHDFTVTGKNKEKAEKYGQVPCKYCSRLVPHGNQKGLTHDKQ